MVGRCCGGKAVGVGDWGCAVCHISGGVMSGWLPVQLLMREEIVGGGFFFRLRDDAFNFVKKQWGVLMMSY
ncbi:hypothetical protein [Bartonella sp. CR84HXZ]|uniref:hypothetical protein n=1 Tax=Bartonella sp. CR84HXZ TaxID=1460997 RepID=UPI0035CF050D